MAFIFQPKTEEEILLEKLLPSGEYNFEVIEAYDKDPNGNDLVSKNGNEMIKIKLAIFNQNNSVTRLFDYLVNSHNFSLKIKHFCESIGLHELYRSGNLSDVNKFIGKSGKLKIIIRTDKTGQYQPQNAIADYIPIKEGETKKEITNKQMIDDDFPF